MGSTPSEPKVHRRRLRYQRTTDEWHTWYALRALGQALDAQGTEAVPDRQTRTTRRIAHVVSRLRLMRNLHRSGQGPVFVAMMGYAELRTLPFCYWTEIIPYAFDCWPPDYARWAAYFRRHRIRLAFFSARGSAEYFTQRLPDLHAVWLPEAVDAAAYSGHRPLVARTTDVLELGRRYDAYHDAIVGGLASAGRTHRFAPSFGSTIFATREELVAGFADSRISICFPRSMTHPAAIGGLETVTHRYFESMASGCLIVGHCPEELHDLFGYNPVVEVDPGREAEQLLAILHEIGAYQELVDRNTRRLLEVGTWKQRATAVIDEVTRTGLLGSA